MGQRIVLHRTGLNGEQILLIGQHSFPLAELALHLFDALVEGVLCFGRQPPRGSCQPYDFAKMFHSDVEVAS